LKGRLFCSESHNGVLLGSASGGDDSRNEGEKHADADEDNRCRNGQDRIQIGNSRKVVQYHIDGDAEQICSAFFERCRKVEKW